MIGGVALSKLVVAASALAALSQRRRICALALQVRELVRKRRHALHLRKERRVADRAVVAGVGRSVYLVLVPHLSALEFKEVFVFVQLVARLEPDRAFQKPGLAVHVQTLVCLYRLATASTWRNVGLFFCGLVPSSVCRVVKRVVYATIRSIRDEIRMPSTAVELVTLTWTFLRADGQPYLLRTIAAGDGSFVRYKRPWHCPMQYWCFRQFPALLLLGLVDGNGLFLFFASAFPGSYSDPVVFTQTTCEAILRQLLEVDFADLDLHAVFDSGE